MKRRAVIGLIILIIAVLLIQQIVSREKATSAQNPQEEFHRARSLLGDNRVDDAIAILNNIIKENPGSNIAANCHFELASIYGLIKLDNARMLQEFQIVADEYKGTPYEFQARSFLIDANYFKPTVPFQTYLDKKNEIIMQFGGINIYDILKEDDINKDEWREKIRGLPANYKNSVIPSSYSQIAGMMSSPDKNKLEESLKLHTFVRTYFPRYPKSWDEIESISNIIMEMKGVRSLSDFQEDKTPPEIRSIAPRENLTIGDKQPKIEVELSAGNIAEFQIMLDQVSFTLDGQDLAEKMSVRTHINKSCSKNADFETIRLIYRLDVPLSLGKHTVYIKAVTSGPPEIATSEKTWSFTVK